MKTLSTTLTLIVFLTTSALFGQNRTGTIVIEKAKLAGEWTFESLTVDSTNCNLPDTFPITTLKFTNTGDFTVVGPRGLVSGHYDFNGNIIRMFDAMKDGNKQEGEEKMTVADLNDTYLTLKINMECAITYPKYKRKK